MKLDISKALFDEALELMPGGVSSPVRAVKPYPFYTRSAKGSHIIDVDGNDYIDYCMGYGPLILGHQPAPVKEAIQRQLDEGWLYGTPCELEVKYARKIREYVPSMQMMRFVSTGGEATMSAIRVARGYTGRDKVVKMEGGFHGAHDCVLVKAGSGAATMGVPDSAGVPRDVAKNTLQVPFNDIKALEACLEANRDEVACVIMEPIMCNMGPIMPKDGYLKAVRNLTREFGVLLIFDEVITGFRVGMYGAQGYYGVEPDMTTLGKIAGGGLPIGIFGGRRDIMEKVAPSGDVYQAGTFNGNPLSLAAGMATLEYLDKARVHRKLNEAGNALRGGLSELFKRTKLGYSVSGTASMFQVFFGPLPENYEQALKCDRELYMKFWSHMLGSGVFLPPSQYETCFLSAAHTDEDFQVTIRAMIQSLGALK
ncbi:glutamate-1-semialdehyde 2,1-aminomutase [Methanocella conradii]|uniref:glutamate-1-semialdehyde 2,1-aminomutase n=1 Tax=Methanocella conradii TaxID=1175444 RepID=UPI00157D591F|nr:glutamate-1-semialdehyde 2,1-aminomutase [Methanocella conradii]